MNDAGRPGRWGRAADAPASGLYGSAVPDRTHEVVSFDGSILIADEFGPEASTSGAVFLHGIGLEARIWHYQTQNVDPSTRRIFYDARGHGRSLQLGDAPFDVATLAADLEAVIEASALGKVVVVGHSMGGMTALEFARRYPGELGTRIRGLVLANTTYAEGLRTFALVGATKLEPHIRRFIDWVLADPRRHRRLKLKANRFSRGIVRTFGFGSGGSRAQIDFVTTILSAFPTRPMTELLRALLTFNVAEQLPGIRLPTLIVAGGRDRITAVRASRHMADAIPGSELEIFERCGHLTIMEEWQRFNVLLEEFLHRTLEGSSGQETALQ